MHQPLERSQELRIGLSIPGSQHKRLSFPSFLPPAQFFQEVVWDRDVPLLPSFW